MTPLSLKLNSKDTLNDSKSKRVPFDPPSKIVPILPTSRGNTSKARHAHVKKLTMDDIPRLRIIWKKKIEDLTGEIPLVLPPFRAINHAIPLIDEMKTLRHRYAKCPDALRSELMAKIEQYCKAQWWEE